MWATTSGLWCVQNATNPLPPLICVSDCQPRSTFVRSLPFPRGPQRCWSVVVPLLSFHCLKLEFLVNSLLLFGIFFFLLHPLPLISLFSTFCSLDKWREIITIIFTTIITIKMSHKPSKMSLSEFSCLQMKWMKCCCSHHYASCFSLSFSSPHPLLEDDGIIVTAHHTVTEYHLQSFIPWLQSFIHLSINQPTRAQSPPTPSSLWDPWLWCCPSVVPSLKCWCSLRMWIRW